MHHARNEDASLPGRPRWDSFDTVAEDGNDSISASRADLKKGKGIIQWPLRWCRCRGMMYAPLAHPKGPPVGAWWTQRRRRVFWCTLLVLVTLGAFAAGISVQVSNLINNLRFRLDHVSLQDLDKCGGPVTVDLLFHVSNPSGIRMRITNLRATLFTAGGLNNSKVSGGPGTSGSTGMGDAPDSATKPESLDLAVVSLGPDGATVESQLLQNVSVRLHAVLTNSFKANLVVQTADPAGAGRIVKDLEIDSPLANLGATFRADVEVWLMGGMLLAIPSSSPWTWGTVSFGDFLNVGQGPANYKESVQVPEKNSGGNFDASDSLGAAGSAAPAGSAATDSQPAEAAGAETSSETSSDSGNCSLTLCWFTNFEGECCTLGDVGSWVKPPSGVNFDLTQKVEASLNFSLSEQAGRLLDARVPMLRVALGRWDLAAGGGQDWKLQVGQGGPGSLEFHLDPTSSAQSPRGHTTPSDDDSGSPGLGLAGGPDDQREGRVKILLQGAGAADMVKSLAQQEAPDSKEIWRLWFVRGPQSSATLAKGADSEGDSEAACGLQNWLQDVTVSANLSDMRASMLYFANAAAGIDGNSDFSPDALAKKLSTSYEGYSDNGKDTILVRASFLNPLDSQIRVGIALPTVSIGVSESPTLLSSSSSFASLGCKSTSALVLPGSRHTLTLALSIRDAKRLGAAISPVMHGGTLQPWINGVSVHLHDHGVAMVEEVQLFLGSLLVGSRLPAFSAGSSFILRDVVGFLDQASVMHGGDPSSLRVLLRKEISAPGAMLFFRANIPTISMVMTRKRPSAGDAAATTAMSRTRITISVSFFSISIDADTTFYNVSSPSCNPLLSSLFLRSGLEASMHLDIGSVDTLPVSLEIPASFLDLKPVWLPGSIDGAQARGGSSPCSVSQGQATGTLCNDVASTISYTPVSLTTSLAYGGSTVASRWMWPIPDGAWNSSLRDASAACQPVVASLVLSPAGAASPEEEAACSLAAAEAGMGASASLWSIEAPVELVVKDICTCLHGVGQCTGPRSRIGSGPGQLPAGLAAGWLPPWSAGSEMPESSWKCQAQGLNVALCSG